MLCEWVAMADWSATMRRSLAGSPALTVAAAFVGPPAEADFKVRQPDAETGEFAVEPLGDLGDDRRSGHGGEASFVEEFEYGVDSFWRTELELEQERDAGAGEAVRFTQITSENFFVFGERR